MHDPVGGSRGDASPRILVIQLTRIGDLLQTTPLLSGLREKHPGAFISLLVNKRFEKAVLGHPDVEEVLVLDADFLAGWQGGRAEVFVEAHRRLRELCGTLRERRFDLVLNASFNEVSATVTRLAQAPEARGYRTRDGGVVEAPDLVSRYVHSQVQAGHYPQLHLGDILQCLGGIAPRARGYSIPPPKAGRWAEAFVIPFGGGGGPVCRAEGSLAPCTGRGPIGLQPGSNSPSKEIPPEAAAELADSLAARTGRRVIVLGSAQEKALYGAIQERARTRLGDATGIGWDELGALLQCLSVLVTGDTGPAHLACAVGTPVVCVFRGESHYSVTGPYGNGHWVLAPPGETTDPWPRREAFLAIVEAVLGGTPPAVPHEELGGWAAMRAGFGDDGWMDYTPVWGAAPGAPIRAGVRQWWKTVLARETGSGTRLSADPAAISGADRREISATIRQADPLLFECAHALRSKNGSAGAVLRRNEELLQRVASGSPERFLVPLLDLLDTERRLAAAGVPAESRASEARVWEAFAARLRDLESFLARPEDAP